jgi:hypothetical protein
MDAIEQHIHQRVLDTWQNFPWKLDYIFYLLFTANDNEVSDIYLNSNESVYLLYCVMSQGQTKQNFDSEKFPMDKDELYGYLNIANTSFRDLDFEYTTKIFSNDYRLKGYKFGTIKGDMIAIRVLDKIVNTNFNDKLEKYILSYDLNQNLTVNSVSAEKRIKV